MPLSFTLASVLFPLSYVGPGLGLGAFLVILCILLSIVLAVAGLFWYPLKRFFRQRRLQPDSDRLSGEG